MLLTRFTDLISLTDSALTVEKMGKGSAPPPPSSALILLLFILQVEDITLLYMAVKRHHSFFHHVAFHLLDSVKKILLFKERLDIGALSDFSLI
jgi:hypothetical protein